MTGRDSTESHRAATPLELLFDLTFVAAFGVAGNALASSIAHGDILAGIGAFAFAMVAIIWAWINYSWFASAFDTDDWLFRVLTMVQMAGVIVLAIGLPTMFASIERGQPVQNEVMVAGYVVMRVAVIAQWLRAAQGNPKYRAVAKTYAVSIGIAQIGWVLLIFLPLDPLGFVLAAIVVLAIDWSSPILAEAKGAHYGGGATPWHPHHIAERYALLTIIALGETVFGTLAAAQSITAAEGWTVSSIMVVGLGVLMAFALWWVYFLVPSAPILAVRRSKALVWGYGHILLFAAIAAVGAGLHVIGYVYDEHYHVSTLVAISSIAVPVLIFMVTLYLLHAWLVSAMPTNTPLQATVIALPVVAVLLAAIGWPLWACLLVVVISPVTIVLSFELGAWRTLDAQLAAVVEEGARASS
ncbi:MULTISPECIES: low temperature requirement protein A [unclassified Microbacterium]|uniref:low temperature requirement protein A n=1 Tax=unclassified Microbacterium TaxID=2609290 RepID=UPI001C615860|nr:MULTISPECIES: low temperature requirement protein A [unclassified Microbacterium]